MKLQTLLFLITIINISFVSTQGSNKLQPTAVTLDKTYTVKLEPNQTQTWILKLQDQLIPSTDLFVTIQSPPNDPLQQPLLTISSQGKDLQQCYSANNEFSGVCRLDASKLKPNMTITIQAECLVECELVMYAQLNQRYLLSLDNTLYLKAPLNAAAEFEFEIQVPSDLNFTQIAIYAQITDFLNATKGLEFYANVGDQKVAIPDETNYKVKGQPIFWGGQGLYFSKEDFQKGRVIKIYISLSQGMQVKLYSQVTNGNDFVIDLGYSYFDFTSSNQPKRYYLDLSGRQKQIEGKTIALGFIVYGGNPTIKVSFDVDFKNTLQGTDHFGTMNFIITQTLRKSLGFKGTIFVSVSSMWNSDYFIASSLFQKNYISIKPQISYYNEALDGEIFNFFFDQTHYFNSTQTNISFNQTFDVKIGLINGSGTFGIRRCRAAEADESPLKCILSSTNDLSNQTILQDFYQIPVLVKKTDEFHQMLFDYDLSSCTRFEVNKNLSAFYCFFHIVAAARSGAIQYTVSLSKRKYSSLLKEGQVVRQTIFKDQYVYYRFALSSLQDVEEIAVYITLIEGEAELLASTFNNYPDFQSKDPKMKTSSSKRILFKKNELAKNIYISVFGMELSQYTIGVVVKRVKRLPDNNSSNQTKNNITEVTKMRLRLGVTQQFILKVGQERAIFEVSSLQEGKFIIEVVQLVGNVEMSVAKSDGSLITCQQSQKTTTKISCSLTLKASENVFATVSGLQGDQQKFVIVYYKSQNCITYSLNLPLYRELAASKSQCILYEITKAYDLQLAISASIAQILHGDFLTQICINNKCKKAESSRHYQLSKAQLEATCDFSTKSASEACKIVLNFINNSTQTLHFSLILEQKSVDVALFDGITETVTSSQLSQSKAKHFYFQVNSNTTVRVFFTSFTSNVFCILAHFISERQFINNSSNIYIPFNTRQTYKKNKGNYYQFYKYSAGTTLYPISTDTLSSICQNCMLTLSVFRLDSMNSHSLSIFQVEVSQEETTLVVGQSKIGFVQEDQIFVYQLQQPTFNDAVVSIRDLNKESFTQKDCFKISLTEADSFASTSMFVVSKNSKKLTLFITTQSKVCNFEISYSLSGGSLIQATEGRFYNFQINAKQSAYFVFNHRNDKPFKIVSILNTGQVQLSITNLQKNKTWKTLLQENPLTYPLVGDANEGELMIDTNSPVYCEKCSYIIAVTTQNGAKGQLLVTQINQTIPLSINGLIREKIKTNVRKVRNYTFSSITTFNISVTIIYGKIKLTIIDPDSKIYREMIITKSQVIRVRHSKQTENYTFEFDYVSATFKINVQAEIDSSFTIKASKIAISQRIFEGISSYFEVKKNKPFVMEFLNLNNPPNDTATINVLIQVIKVVDNDSSNVQPIINLVAVYSQREGNQVVPLPATKRINSQSTINIQFPLKKGDYYLNLTCDVQAVLSVLLVKESLIHLKPQTSVMMSKPGIFQLYSPFKSVMIQIFSCEGDLSVEATSDYSNFQSPSQKKDSDEIVLQQTNYGGHYVISSTNVFGQYFIKVKNRAHQNTSLLYFLNYYYYDSKDVLPYKTIAQGSTSLTYSLNADSIVFTIEAVSIKDDYKDQIKSVAIQYYLYVDTQKSKVSKFANCRLEKSVRVFNATNVRADSVYFTVNLNDLQKSKDAIFFVGAEAIVNIEPSSSKDEHYPRQLNMIYDVIEITNSKLPVMKDIRNGFSVKTIIFWILFPFALAGLALFFAIKFCIKKYRGMVPDNFVQEQVGQSQQQVVQGKQIKSSSNASGTFKQEIQ